MWERRQSRRNSRLAPLPQALVDAGLPVTRLSRGSARCASASRCRGNEPHPLEVLALSATGCTDPDFALGEG